MLRPAAQSEILPLIRGTRGRARHMVAQALGSQCWAFEAGGRVAAFGGIYRAEGYGECWFMVADASAVRRRLRRLVAELTDLLVLHVVTEPGLPLVAHVLAGDLTGAKIALLLGFGHHGASAMAPDADLWVFGT